MGNKKVSIKKSPLRNNAECLPLDNLIIEFTDDELAEKYLSGLQASGFISQNKAYLANYINCDLSIALSHLKARYKQYVLVGKWAQIKFDTVLKEIINKRQFFTAKAFLLYGTEYDTGKLTKTKSVEVDKERLAAIIRRNMI